MSEPVTRPKPVTRIVEIADPADPRLDLYRNVKDRDLTGRDGLFMAEGKVVLERLFRSRIAVCISVLTTRDRLKTLDISGLGDAPIYIVDPAVMDQVAGFPIHRGYLALGRYMPPQSLTQVLTGYGRRRVLVLSAIANVDNMGGLLRNAAAFGVDAVIIDDTCCDPLYRKAIRVSVGGVFQVPHFRVTGLVETLNAQDLTAYALSPSGSVALDQVEPAERSAFLFGAEGPGLPQDMMNACTSVRIDMHGGFDSLNVATTSGIVLYHMCR